LFLSTKQQGFVLGNPATDTDIDLNSRIPFAHGKALISDEHYEVPNLGFYGFVFLVTKRK